MRQLSVLAILSFACNGLPKAGFDIDPDPKPTLPDTTAPDATGDTGDTDPPTTTPIDCSVLPAVPVSYQTINFFETDKAGCDASCGAGATAPEGPVGRAEISVRELVRMGYTAEQARRADVTRDGMVDMEDMAAYLNGDVPPTRKRATSTRGQIGRR